MAAVIQCEACGKVCKHNKAVHVRVHELVSATEYRNATSEHYEICDDCHKKFKAMIKQGVTE